jgi:hypothetical protein
LNGPVVPNNGIYEMRVQATGALHGSITRIERVLRDRQTGQVLGTRSDSGPFLAAGNTPCRNVDPFLLSGTDMFRYNEDLGFVGRSAILETTVSIRDTANAMWTTAASSSWELLANPTVKQPGRTNQNNPATGCPFDSVAGYGLVVELSWDPPRGMPPVDYYDVELVDGSGHELLPGITITEGPGTTFKAVLCRTYVPLGSERGAKVGVAAGVRSPFFQLSAWSTATFDFQSCRDAGTPACQ